MGVIWFLILGVPEGKQGQNCLHMDLRPQNQAVEARRRSEDLGAAQASIGQGEDATWVVMADPEGNEFCVFARTAPSGAQGS